MAGAKNIAVSVAAIHIGEKSVQFGSNSLKEDAPSAIHLTFSSPY